MKNYSLSLAQFPCFILFLLYFLTTISSSFSSNFSSSTQLCSHHQALSLLQFKQSFSIQRSPFWFARNYQYDQYPKTESWKEGTDCCLWDGVTCDLKTGQVTKLDLSFSMLHGTLHSNNSLLSSSSSKARPLLQRFQLLQYLFSIWPVFQFDAS